MLYHLAMLLLGKKIKINKYNFSSIAFSTFIRKTEYWFFMQYTVYSLDLAVPCYVQLHFIAYLIVSNQDTLLHWPQ